MANTRKNQKKQKVDKRRVAFGVLAGLMALLILLPMLTMILGGAGAVTQSEIDALKQQQAESQARQQALQAQLVEVTVTGRIWLWRSSPFTSTSA